MKAIKLIYFADRYHLRKYGRPVTNDEYVAMAYGPVGSKTKDIAENTSFLDIIESEYNKQYIEKQGIYDVQSVHDVDMNVFSDSDIEAMEFAVKYFGHLDQFQLAEVSHAYSVYYFTEKSFTNPEPHYFIVVNKAPLKDKFLIMVNSTSQVEKALKRKRHLPNTLVKIDNTEYAIFIRASVVDCNSVIKKTIENSRICLTSQSYLWYLDM